MKHRNKIINVFLLITLALFTFSCAKQTAQSGDNSNVNISSGEKAQSPTEAYKMLFAAVKAKDTEKIKQMMTKSSLGLAEFNANNQKITLEKSLENGLVAPTLSPTITEIRDERIKDNIGAIEVRNPQTNMWEELPFLKEDGGWKLAVGNVFQNTHDPNNLLGKGKAQIEREASNTGVPMLSDSNANNTMINGKKSVEVPKEDKPKK